MEEKSKHVILIQRALGGEIEQRIIAEYGLGVGILKLIYISTLTHVIVLGYKVFLVPDEIYAVRYI